MYILVFVTFDTKLYTCRQRSGDSWSDIAEL